MIGDNAAHIIQVGGWSEREPQKFSLDKKTPLKVQSKFIGHVSTYMIKSLKK